MKAIVVVVCCLFSAAFALQVPPNIIRVKRGSAPDVVNVVEWMTGAGQGAPRWAERLRSDYQCRVCPILQPAAFTGWPGSCDECVKPFLNDIKAVPYCHDCYQNQRNCVQCQRGVKQAVNSGAGYRNPDADKFLRKIYMY